MAYILEIKYTESLYESILHNYGGFSDVPFLKMIEEAFKAPGADPQAVLLDIARFAEIDESSRLYKDSPHFWGIIALALSSQGFPYNLDSIFEEILNPKVKGLWSLHIIFTEVYRFFILMGNASEVLDNINRPGVNPMQYDPHINLEIFHSLINSKDQARILEIQHNGPAMYIDIPEFTADEEQDTVHSPSWLVKKVILWLNNDIHRISWYISEAGLYRTCLLVSEIIASGVAIPVEQYDKLFEIIFYFASNKKNTYYEIIELAHIGETSIREYLHPVTLNISHMPLILTLLSHNLNINELKSWVVGFCSRFSQEGAHTFFDLIIHKRIKGEIQGNKFEGVPGEVAQRILNMNIRYKNFKEMSISEINIELLYYLDSSPQQVIDIGERNIKPSLFLSNYLEFSSVLNIKYQNAKELIWAIKKKAEELGVDFLFSDSLSDDFNRLMPKQGEIFQILQHFFNQKIINNISNLRYLQESGIDSLIKVMGLSDPGAITIDPSLLKTIRNISNHNPQALPGILSILIDNKNKLPEYFKSNGISTNTYEEAVRIFHTPTPTIFKIWQDFWTHPGNNKNKVSWYNEETILTHDQKSLLTELCVAVVTLVRQVGTNILTSSEHNTEDLKAIERAYQLRDAITGQVTDSMYIERAINQKLILDIAHSILGIPEDQAFFNLYNYIKSEDLNPGRGEVICSSPSSRIIRSHLNHEPVNHSVTHSNLALFTRLKEELKTTLLTNRPKEGNNDDKKALIELSDRLLAIIENLNTEEKGWKGLLNTLAYFDSNGDIRIETTHITSKYSITEDCLDKVKNLGIKLAGIRSELCGLFGETNMGEKSIGVLAALTSSPLAFLSRYSVGSCTFGDVKSFLGSVHFDVFESRLDEDIVGIIGNNYIYALEVFDEAGQRMRILFLRGVNLTKKYNTLEFIPSYLEELKSMLTKVADENDFDGLVICGHTDWHPDSNNPNVVRYFDDMWRTANKRIEFCERFQLTGESEESGEFVTEAHILWEKAPMCIPRVVTHHTNLLTQNEVEP